MRSPGISTWFADARVLMVSKDGGPTWFWVQTLLHGLQVIGSPAGLTSSLAASCLSLHCNFKCKCICLISCVRHMAADIKG